MGLKIIAYYENGKKLDITNKGVVSNKVVVYPEYHSAVLELTKSGVSKRQAIEEVSEKCGVCTDTIWRAMRFMK